MEPEHVMTALDGVEEKLVGRGEREPFLRPWSGEVPRLELDTTLTVPYPADEEDNGMVYIAWRGPSAVTALYRMFATMILMEYLTETSVSPLQARFVEVDSPMASAVRYNFIENKDSCVFLMFENVPKEKVPEVGPELKKVLQELVAGKIAWDSRRMETVIQRRILEQSSQMENSPHDAVAFMAIGDMLYGNSEADLDTRLNSADQFRSMLAEPVAFWYGLVQQMMLDSPSVVVMGVPSIVLQDEMRKTEEERIRIQKNDLGEAGLAKKKVELEEAMEKNEIEAPEATLRSVPVPSASSIKFHPVSSTNSLTKVDNFDTAAVPVYFQLDQVKANFVYLYTVMDTSGVPLALKPFLPLLVELLLESPLLEGDTETPYEEVVAALSRDCLQSSFGLGLGGGRFLPGGFAQAAILFLQAEPAKYPDAVAWIRKLLYQTVFKAERVRVLATKMENSVAELKRRGSKVVSIMMNSVLFSEESNHQVANLVRQQVFLKSVLRKLDCSASAVLAQLEEVRFHLTKPANLLVHMAADLSLLSDPASPWRSLLPAHIPGQVSEPRPQPEHLLALPPPAHLLVGLGSCESSFLSRSAPAITDPRSPELPALLLAIQYLTQLEGPMWRQIRGAGLAYGYFIFPSTNKGQLFLTLYKATHPVKAYQESKRIVMTQVGGKENWDLALFESAKSSLIFELIEKEKTVGEVVQESLLNSFKGVDSEFNREFLRRVDGVRVGDLARVGHRYLAPLFSDHARTTLVCNPSKIEEIREGFAATGINFTVLESIDKLMD